MEKLAIGQEDVRDKAHEIARWLHAAVMDVAAGNPEMGMDPDDFYNDAGCLSDLIGDRIHDAGRADYAVMVAIAEEMRKAAHSALKEALDWFLDGWRRELQKRSR